MNIKAMPSQFFIGIFIVVYFLYSFVAFRNRFEEKWRTVQLGDSKSTAVALLDSSHKEQLYMQGRVVELEQSSDDADIVILHLVWEIGVNNFYVLGIDEKNTVTLKARTEVSRLGAGGSN